MENVRASPDRLLAVIVPEQSSMMPCLFAIAVVDRQRHNVNEHQPETKSMEPLNILLTQLREFARRAIELVPQLIFAVLLLFATWLVAKGIRFLVHRAIGSRLRPSLRTLFGNLGYLGIWFLGIMGAAIVVFPNMTPAKMLAGIGLGSVAIGFAFKDIFENFLAGIIILFRREMRIGDFVECEGIDGKVEEISIRETHIRQTDSQLVIVPNALLFKSPLTIRTDLSKRRATVVCGIAYGEDVDAAREVIREAVEACKTVDGNYAQVQVFASAFGASSVDFEVAWWTGSQPVDIRRSRDEVIAAIKRGLDESGIEIPFPYRTLTFSGPVPVSSDRADPFEKGQDGA